MPGAMPEKSVPLLSEVHLKRNEAIGLTIASTPIEVYEPSVGLTATAVSDNSGEKGRLSRLVHLVSLLVNILLFGSKLYVYIQSQSMVVLAALIDSTVDLLAQGILLMTNRLATVSRDDDTQILYPAGRSRAEPIGVIACALLMAMASAQVIRDSSVVLWEWQHSGTVRLLQIDFLDEGLLAMTTFLKFILYVWCERMAKQTGNITVEAVAQDHLNDVLSNMGALLAAAATQITPALWLADPCGAIFISIYIVRRALNAAPHTAPQAPSHTPACVHARAPHTHTHAHLLTAHRTHWLTARNFFSCRFIRGRRPAWSSLISSSAAQPTPTSSSWCARWLRRTTRGRRLIRSGHTTSGRASSSRWRS